MMDEEHEEYRDGKGKLIPSEFIQKREDGSPIFLQQKTGTEIVKKGEGVYKIKGMDRVITPLMTSPWLCDSNSKMCSRIVILKHYLEDGHQEITTHQESFERNHDKGDLNRPEVANYNWGHYFNEKEITPSIEKDFNERVASLFKCNY